MPRHSDGCRKLPARHADGGERRVLPEEREQIQFQIIVHPVKPEKHDGAAARDKIHGNRRRFPVAAGLDDCVVADSAAQRQRLGHDALCIRVDHNVRAEAQRRLPLFRDRLDHDDLPDRVLPHKLEDDLPHGPAAEQNDPLAIAKPRLAYGVHGHHQRLDQTSGTQAHLLRQAEDLLLADIQILRHQIGIAGTGVRAVFRAVAAAGVAQAARLIRVDRHAVARVERTDILAHRCHDAGALVPQIAVQRIRRRSAQHHHIVAADRRERHSDLHLARPRRGRHGKLLEIQLPVRLHPKRPDHNSASFCMAARYSCGVIPVCFLNT